MPYPGTLSLNVINAYVNLKRGRGSILMFANMPGHLSEVSFRMDHEISRHGWIIQGRACWHGAGYDEAYNIRKHIYRAFMFQCWLLKWLDTQKVWEVFPASGTKLEPFWTHRTGWLMWSFLSRRYCSLGSWNNEFGCQEVGVSLWKLRWWMYSYGIEVARVISTFETFW